MKNDAILRLARESQWYAEYHPQVRRIASAWQPWLADRGSLTEQLIKFSANNFRVKVISQRWAKPLAHEAAQLNIPNHLATRIREVELHCNDQAVVYARSVMPLKMYLQQRHTLQNIGTRPLGQLLFREGKIRTSKRRVSIYAESGAKPIYGRSTPYRYFGNEILVSEFFVSRCLVERCF